MPSPIQGAARYAAVATSTQSVSRAAQSADAEGFSTRLAGAVGQVDAAHLDADKVLAELASGENVDLHGASISLEKADIALRTMVSVRDRVIAAYEQVMNMAV